MLQRALAYLDKAPPQERLGAKALAGLALLKGERPTNHPRIQEAVQACQKAATDLRTQHTHDVVYDLGIAIIFLCELDPDQYRSEITALMQLLRDWQKRVGGWGYVEGAFVDWGDTSVTQYAVLATWAADRSGAVPASPESVANVCNWLLRTQDVSGGWGYRGKDPGSFQRVPQYPVQHSLCAAGLGSVYICADLLRMTSAAQRDPGRGLPPAVRRVPKPGEKGPQGPLTSAVEEGNLRRAMADGDQWFAQNYQISPMDWRFYYMYGLERYQSFRELATGDETAEPKWYNDGVTSLQQAQQADGSWEAEGTAVPDTCFGILFLTARHAKVDSESRSVRRPPARRSRPADQHGRCGGRRRRPDREDAFSGTGGESAGDSGVGRR